MTAAVCTPGRAAPPTGPTDGGLADLARLTAAVAADRGPTGAARRAALEAFRGRGLPSPRDERWRFTPLAALVEGARAAAPTTVPAALVAQAEARIAVLRAGLSADPETPPGPVVVVVNGRVDPARSTLDGLPAGVRVLPLEADAALVAERLGGALSPEDDPLVALNTAALESGLVIDLAPGARLDAPLLLVRLVVPGAAPSAMHSRVLVTLGRGAALTLVEVACPLGSCAIGELGAASPAVVTNAVSELVLGDGATLRHARAHLEADGEARAVTIGVRVGKDATYEATAVQLGGRLQRTDQRVRLVGAGASASLRGLLLGRHDQVVDDHVLLDHGASHGQSRQLFKAVLADRSRAVVDAQVHVRPGAQRTDAGQQLRALLLSDKAQAQQNPRFEIHADDVKCGHGATVGQLDPAQLFYLRARGLSLDEARRLLVLAFAAEVAQGAPEAVRGWLEGLVRARLEAAAGGAA